MRKTFSHDKITPSKTLPGERTASTKMDFLKNSKLQFPKGKFEH